MPMIILLLIINLTVGGVPLAQSANVSGDLIKLARECQLRAEKIRQLKAKKPIRWKVSSRADILEYVKKTLDKQYAAGELEAEGLFAKALGLIPDDLEYRNFMLELMEEQIGGVYDPFEETFRLASWLAPAVQEGVIVHEVTHALQDQHFDIDSFLERIANNSDAMLARSAVAEGDATLVMFIDSLEKSGAGISLEDLAENFGAMKRLIGLSMLAFPSFGKAPKAIRETLVFPYLRGLYFVIAAKKRGGWEAVNRLYRRLPRSTEQVLHPERYFDEYDQPTEVQLPGVNKLLGDEWHEIYNDVLGEFTISLLLSELGEEEASRAAEGWDGDRTWAWKKGDQLAWHMLSVWDSEKDAVEFSAAVAAMVPKKYRQLTADALSGKPVMSWSTNDGMKILIERRGRRVLVVYGLPPDIVERLRQTLPSP
jgi:hypothetical protein